MNGNPMFLLAKEPRGNPVCRVDAIVVDDGVDVPDVEGSYEGEYVNQDGKLVLSGGGKCVFLKNPPYGGISYGGKSKSSVSGGQGKLTFTDNNDYYEGEFKGYRFGNPGKYLFASGRWCDGEFKKFVFTDNNDCQEGEFKDYRFNGQGKLIFTDNNDYYEGEFKNYQFNGRGKRVFPDGNSYDGDFKNGEFDGRGVYTFAGGGWYEGDFKSGEFDGQGKLIFTDNNDYYEGEFKNGQFDGRGRRVFPDGNSYEGDFKRGRFEGQGKFTFIGNNDYYEGEFKNHKFDGRGKRVFPSGESYEGDFKNNQFNGRGKLTLVNNDSIYYEGDFKNDQFNGRGKRVFPDGDSYEGDFKNSMLNGRGVFIYADGGKKSGTWSNGKEEGVFEWSRKNGELFELLYRGGGLESRTYRSTVFYGEDGKIAEPGAGGERRDLYITKFASDSGEVTSSSYIDYHVYGGPKRTIRVDYSRLNELANEGTDSLDDLVTKGAIRDVTEGPEGSGKIRTFGVAVECLRRAVRQYMENVERVDGGILEVGMKGEMMNLLQLTNLGTPEQFNSMRFANPGWDRVGLESIYRNLETFLGALGISSANLGNIKTNFITLSLITTNRRHGVSLIINVRTIGELLIHQAGQLSSINANVMLCFDSSRAMDCQKDGLDLGGITKYCRFVNRNLQKHGVCWLYAVTATLVAARDPDLVGRLLTGRIQSYGFREEGERPGGPNEFERKVLQLLLDVTTGAGMVVGEQLVSRLVVEDGLMRWLKIFSKDQTLINILNSRINAVLESTEKERGIKFSPNFVMGVIKCYADQLSKKIQDINSRAIGAQLELGLEKDDEDAEHILILDKIEAFQELEIEMVDYLGETSHGLLAPEESGPETEEVPEVGTEGNPGQLATRLGQGNGELEVLATEAATQALDRKPWKWRKYLLPWF
jgi:hypothetical protein